MRREAINLTKRGIDAAAEMGAPMMTLWLGQDGFDYGLQCDYDRVSAVEIEGLREGTAHNPNCLISIEYKPNEPRPNALLPDAATTLLAIDEVGLPNLGVTIDFAHALYANETPALAAAHILRRSRLLGLQLNDGYAKRDDGLMVASVHELATLDLLRACKRGGYEGAIYFDTFLHASGLDPVAECAANIATVRHLMDRTEKLDSSNALAEAQSRQDPVAALAELHNIPK